MKRDRKLVISLFVELVDLRLRTRSIAGLSNGKCIKRPLTFRTFERQQSVLKQPETHTDRMSTVSTFRFGCFFLMCCLKLSFRGQNFAAEPATRGHSQQIYPVVLPTVGLIPWTDFLCRSRSLIVAKPAPDFARMHPCSLQRWGFACCS